jgi:hypothetical protein
LLTVFVVFLHFSCHWILLSQRRFLVPIQAMQVSRPKSMPDFSALLDASTPLFEARAQNRRQTSPVRGQGYPRKKVSISLAAGLIMNENQKNAGALDSPYKQSLDGTQEEEQDVSEDALFHAYALKVGALVPLSAFHDWYSGS